MVDGIARHRRPARAARVRRPPGVDAHPRRRLGRRRRPAERGSTRRAARSTGDAVCADETVTFGVAKPVHLLPADGAGRGRLTVVDIGLDRRHRRRRRRAARPRRRRRGCWPVPAPSDDKYSRGVLGVVAGGETYTGAAVLSVDRRGRGRAPAWSATSAPPTPDRRSSRPRSPEAVHGAGPGAGLGGRARARPATSRGRAAGRARAAREALAERPAGRRRRRRR